MHKLCLTRDISIFSVQLRSLRTSGTSPIQRPLAKALIGSLLTVSSEAQSEQTLLLSGSRTGPDNGEIGSLELRRSFLVVGIEEEQMSTSRLRLRSSSFCKDFLNVNKPHTLQASSI